MVSELGHPGEVRAALGEPVLQGERDDTGHAGIGFLRVGERRHALAADQVAAIAQLKVDQAGLAVADGPDHAPGLVDPGGERSQLPRVGEVPHGAMAADVEDRIVVGGVQAARGGGARERAGVVAEERGRLGVAGLDPVAGRVAALDRDEVHLVPGVGEHPVRAGGLRHVEAGPAAGVAQLRVAGQREQYRWHGSAFPWCALVALPRSRRWGREAGWRGRGLAPRAP